MPKRGESDSLAIMLCIEADCIHSDMFCFLKILNWGSGLDGKLAGDTEKLPALRCMWSLFESRTFRLLLSWKAIQKVQGICLFL